MEILIKPLEKKVIIRGSYPQRTPQEYLDEIIPKIVDYTITANKVTFNYPPINETQSITAEIGQAGG